MWTGGCSKVICQEKIIYKGLFGGFSTSQTWWLGWWFQIFLMFTPKIGGNRSHLTSVYSSDGLGKNHQLDKFFGWVRQPAGARLWYCWWFRNPKQPPGINYHINWLYKLYKYRWYHNLGWNHLTSPTISPRFLPATDVFLQAMDTFLSLCVDQVGFGKFTPRKNWHIP